MICTGALVQRLLFPCTLAQRNAFPAIADQWFEMLQFNVLRPYDPVLVASALFLSVPVSAPKYRPIWDKDADQSRYRDIGTGQFARIATARYSFEADIALPEVDFAGLFHRIRLECLSPDLETHQPITVLDFVKPTWNDATALADGTRYTPRQGRIIDIKENQGNIKRGDRLYGGEFTVTFQERRRRLLG